MKTSTRPTLHAVQKEKPTSSARYQGRPRKNLTPEETRLVPLLWPTFSRLLKKSKKVRAFWRGVPDKRNFFICLTSTVFFTPETELSQQSLVACFKCAPDLTCMVWPMLRRRAAKIDLTNPTSKFRAALVNPPEGDSRKLVKISAWDADIRRRTREAAADFMARTAD